MDADVARIVKIGEQGAEMGFVGGEGGVLGDQHFLILAAQRRVQFSLAQQRQKGKSGWPELRISATGRSSSCLPLNQ